MKTAVDYIIEQLWAPCRGIPSHIIEEAKRLEKEQILKARLDGFKISGEGYNGEYPYEGHTDEYISHDIENGVYYDQNYNQNK